MSAAHPSIPPAPCDETWTLDTGGAEFHFESADALLSGVELARSQSWVADYRVDAARRTLWVRFASGSVPAAQLH